MTKLKNGTTVVIANSEKALYLVNVTDGENPHLTVMDKKHQDNPPNREQVANKRGRMSDGFGGPLSAFSDTDWHELAKERFADDIADHLYKLAHKGKIDSLVIVAGPQVLGNIRDALHKEVSDKIIGEIAKNLAGHPLDEIEKIVMGELAAV